MPYRLKSPWEKFDRGMKICEPCAGTGFSDKVTRQTFSMQPTEKICPICHGRGWVPRNTDT